jgi:L-malate glycosyltransferase
VTPYYQTADVLALPSLSEGSPNVLLEAMASGVPVVATSVGGIPEIVTHGETALLVSPHSSVAIAEAIDRVLSDPITASSLARLARLKVETDYSQEKRAHSLVKIYTDVYRSASK